MSDVEQKAIDLLASVAAFLENVAKSKVPSIKGQNHEAATHRHLRAMKLSAANIRDEINVFLGDDAALTRVLEKMQADGKINIDGDMVYLAPAKPDPLVEVLGDLEWNNNSPECAAELRAALEARGLEIKEKGQ